MGRTAEKGDELGSQLVAARIVRDLVRLCFLLERRYPPYMKWLGSAFARLESAADIGPALDARWGRQITRSARRGWRWRTDSSASGRTRSGWRTCGCGAAAVPRAALPGVGVGRFRRGMPIANQRRVAEFARAGREHRPVRRLDGPAEPPARHGGLRRRAVRPADGSGRLLEHEPGLAPRPRPYAPRVASLGGFPTAARIQTDDTHVSRGSLSGRNDAT